MTMYAIKVCKMQEAKKLCAGEIKGSVEKYYQHLLLANFSTLRRSVMVKNKFACWRDEWRAIFECQTEDMRDWQVVKQAACYSTKGAEREETGLKKLNARVEKKQRKNSVNWLKWKSDKNDVYSNNKWRERGKGRVLVQSGGKRNALRIK